MAKPKKLSPWWYVFCAFFPVAGCTYAGFSTVGRLSDKVEGLPRVVIPGEKNVELDAGEYWGFYEPRSVVDGETFNTPLTVSDVRCRMLAPSGANVKIGSSSTSMEYDVGAYRGTSMFRFRTNESGAHNLACQWGNTNKTDRIVVAVGNGIFSSIGTPLMIAAGSILTGLAAFFVIFFRRRAAKTAAQPPTP